jgi:hypothetical protein
MIIFWISIPLAVLCVACAIGIPYWLTHRHMNPHDRADTHAYLGATSREPGAEGMTSDHPHGAPGRPQSPRGV